MQEGKAKLDVILFVIIFDHALIGSKDKYFSYTALKHVFSFPVGCPLFIINACILYEQLSKWDTSLETDISFQLIKSKDLVGVSVHNSL